MTYFMPKYALTFFVVHIFVVVITKRYIVIPFAENFDVCDGRQNFVCIIFIFREHLFMSICAMQVRQWQYSSNGSDSDWQSVKLTE